VEGELIRVEWSPVSVKRLQPLANRAVENGGSGVAHLGLESLTHQRMCEVVCHRSPRFFLDENLARAQDVQGAEERLVGEVRDSLQRREGNGCTTRRCEMCHPSRIRRQVTESAQDRVHDRPGQLQLLRFPTEPPSVMLPQLALPDERLQGLFDEEGVSLGPLV